MQPLPQKEVIPLFPATPSKGWGPVKLPFFENLFGDSTPLPAERGGGAHYHSVFIQKNLKMRRVHLINFRPY